MLLWAYRIRTEGTISGNTLWIVLSLKLLAEVCSINSWSFRVAGVKVGERFTVIGVVGCMNGT